MWTGADGCLTTIFIDGTTVRTTPVNTGVKRRHNTIRNSSGQHDADLEIFLSENIDGPVAPILKRLGNESSTRILGDRLLNRKLLAQKKDEIRRLGFRIPSFIECLSLCLEEKKCVARYLASMIVRVPSYKDQLNNKNTVNAFADAAEIDIKSAKIAIDHRHVNILRNHLAEYTEKLCLWQWVVLDADGDHDYLFSDSPAIPVEFNGGDIDVFFPITPRRALLVTRRWKSPLRDAVQLFKAANKNVNYYNRCIVLNAERMVFSRDTPPARFICRHFGQRQLRLAVHVNRNDSSQPGGDFCAPLLQEADASKSL